LNAHKKKDHSFLSLSEQSKLYEEEIDNIEKTLKIWESDDKWLR
jgi:hypothetical protein